MAGMTYKGKLVFGLDIGTRSIVGTVGYRDQDRFVVVAQCAKEHETRAMLDGQIHDIKKVGGTILAVKETLEKELGGALEEVCIAAAGRVLRTVTTHAEIVFPSEREVLEEDVYALSAQGVEQAYAEFLPANDTGMKFYCVGYSVVRYYINGYVIGNPQDHKASGVAADIIVTFLPEDVVDGLYKAVEYAGLKVANLTLEPIAAIQVAIPEKFRMLNIALVDVGAGTSDISITRDGAIIAYGMIPVAGDSLTEIIARHCLVDFNTAEQIKRAMETGGEIAYTDIMGLPQTITGEELGEILKPAIEDMTQPVADCIKELNGEKAVSAVFVVGGGGRIPGYTQSLAEKLGIVKERVAVRGEDVMGFVDFPSYVKKDSLLVTPVGICLSFYEQNNNFVFVTFNDERIKIYDNGKLSVVDAAMQADFPNDGLFPKRGKELNFTVDGKLRIRRGEPGEAAIITVNGIAADIHTPIKANDVVRVMPSTAGAPAAMEIGKLPEYHQSISVSVNGKQMELPKFVRVNGELKSGYYEIQDGDEIAMQDYYTAEQVLTFLDLELPEGAALFVNNEEAKPDTPVFENFSVAIKFDVPKVREAAESQDEEAAYEEEISDGSPEKDAEAMSAEAGTETPKSESSAEEPAKPEPVIHDIHVVVNGSPIVMRGKKEYVYVDVFDYIDFDLKNPAGSSIITNLNGQPAEYLREITDGDVIDIRWKN